MSLSVGIVGLPNVGKSTLFNALRSAQGKLSNLALVANYPFATIEPNVGIVPVPDVRLDKLAHLVEAEEKMASCPPIVPATVKFVDIAGLVKGASTGEGLGNQFLSHIREVEAIVQVVRNFSNEEIIRAGSTDPCSDINIINTELLLADIQTVNKRIESLKRQTRSLDFEKEIKPKIGVLEKVLAGFDQGRLALRQDLTEEEVRRLADSHLLTLKPFIYVFNSDEAAVAHLDQSELPPSFKEPIGSSPFVFISAKLEMELASLSDDEQKAYLQELAIKENGLDKVVRSAFKALNRQTFITAGSQEVRAWTIKRGDQAPAAAGQIHSDFERGFIAAEVIGAEELLSVGSYKKARELGKVRLEGKTYEVQDGDVIEFRFSV